MKELELKYRKDYLSVDKLTAISSYGEFFEVGDKVNHDDAKKEIATITSFGLNTVSSDVIAYTDLGFARISFINKIN